MQGSRMLGDCNCMTLRRAARRISQAYDEALAPAGLRATQFSILALLDRAGGLSVNELAAKLDLDRTTTGKNLRPLERDELVVVEVSQADRRSHVIALTAAGRKRLQAAVPLWSGAQRQFEKDNGRRRMRVLRETLQELRIS